MQSADPGCQESLNDLGPSPLTFKGEAHSPDRPLAFIPNVTIVLLKIGEKTQICAWKEQNPHCHVDPVSRMLRQTSNA